MRDYRVVFCLTFRIYYCRTQQEPASERAGFTATMDDWRLVEESKVFGALGDAVRSLTKVPDHYLKEDLAKIGASDKFDNTTVFYGPDESGAYYQISHRRKQNWKLRHNCSAEVRVQQPARLANQSLQNSTRGAASISASSRQRRPFPAAASISATNAPEQSLPAAAVVDPASPHRVELEAGAAMEADLRAIAEGAPGEASALVTSSTLFQLVSCLEPRCLDMGRGKRPHNSPNHDSWATRLVLWRIDGPSSGPVDMSHTVKLISQDGHKCLDIGRGGGTYSDAGHNSWATVFSCRPLDGSTQIRYGVPLAFFSGPSADCRRLDIGCASSGHQHDSWATKFNLVPSIWSGLDEPVRVLLSLSLRHSHNHNHTHSLSLVLVVMMKSKELECKISHARSLILSLCATHIQGAVVSVCAPLISKDMWFCKCTYHSRDSI